jgi:hypothetical protein
MQKVLIGCTKAGRALRPALVREGGAHDQRNIANGRRLFCFDPSLASELEPIRGDFESNGA